MPIYVDLINQVQKVLPQLHGGTGNEAGYGNERLLLAYMNDTGGAIAIGSVVKLAQTGHDDTRVAPTTAASDAAIGVVVGRYKQGTEDAGAFEAVAPAHQDTVAVCVVGRCTVLVASAVTIGQYGLPSGTSGRAQASTGPSIGALGYFESSTGGSGQAQIVLTGAQGSFPLTHYTINYLISGGTGQPTLGIQGIVKCDAPGAIVAAHLFQIGSSGSCTVSLKKATLAVPTPSFSNIVGSNPMVLSAAKGSSNDLSGWTTSIAMGDLLEVTLDAISVITTVTMALKIRRTN